VGSWPEWGELVFRRQEGDSGVTSVEHALGASCGITRFIVLVCFPLWEQGSSHPPPICPCGTCGRLALLSGFTLESYGALMQREPTRSFDLQAESEGHLGDRWGTHAGD
jgi:hypothetical protein